MRRRLLLVLFFCATISCFVFAQTLNIVVKVGEEVANFAYIYNNNKLIGITDSLGLYSVDIGKIKIGDTIYAEYANFKSNNVVYNGNLRDICLNIEEAVLQGITVEAERGRTLEEYLSILDKFRYRYEITYYTYKAHCHFYYEFLNKGEKEGDFSGNIEFSFKRPPINGLYVKDYWLTHSPDVDSLVMAKNAFNILYASNILYRISNKDYLRRVHKKRELLLRKIISQKGRVIYCLMEGSNRENQTVVELNANEDRIEKIYRKFLGGGMGIIAEASDEHTIEIIPKYEGKRMYLSEIKTSMKSKELKIFVHTYNIFYKLASKKEYKLLKD